MSDAVTDSGFALRSFRRSPGWTFVTLLTIALGVGASTAVFSVADTFLIRPLAYRDASRVYTVALQGSISGEAISLPIPADVVREWRNSARTLGATRRNIAGLFVRDALGQAVLGTGIGLAGALGVARLIRMSFYGVQSFDTITLIVAAASMLLACLAACAGPLFRATRVDPVVAIRTE